jgi:hypothetical protein
MFSNKKLIPASKGVLRSARNFIVHYDGDKHHNLSGVDACGRELNFILTCLISSTVRSFDADPLNSYDLFTSLRNLYQIPF